MRPAENSAGFLCFRIEIYGVLTYNISVDFDSINEVSLWNL